MTTDIEGNNDHGQPLVLGAASPSRYPGLPDAVARFTRALSVTASQPVTSSAPRLRQDHGASLRADDTHWFGTPSGTVIGFRRDGAHALAELLLGLVPDPQHRPLSPVELTLLRTNLLPMLQPLVDELSDGEPGRDLSGLTGQAAIDALGRSGVLSTVTLEATAQAAGGSTVTSEVIVATAQASAGSRHPARLEDLDGRTGDIPLQVTVALPPTRFAAGDLANLAEGSELVLSATQDTPWLVRAGDTVVASARIGQVHGRRSVSVEMTWRSNPMSEQILSGLAAAQQAVDGAATEEPDSAGLGRLADVTVDVSAELGRLRMPLRDVAALHIGQVLELDKSVDSPVTITANGVPIALADAIVVEGRIGLRIVERIH